MKFSSPRIATWSLILIFSLLAGCETLNTVSGWLNNRMTFTAPQLQRYLDNSFPRDFDKLGGLVSARLSQPKLSLPANDTRLRLEFDVQLGALGATHLSRGHFAVLSGLKYNPETRGLHLENPELLSLDLGDSGSLLRGGSRELINTVLTEYARQTPVYQIDHNLLSKLPAGKRIGSTQIENGLVVINLAQ